MIYKLIELHKKNVIHLDIKADNFLINEHMETKIIDFGLSTGLGSALKYRDKLSKTGTAAYKIDNYYIYNKDHIIP